MFSREDLINTINCYIVDEKEKEIILKFIQCLELYKQIEEDNDNE